MGWEDWLRNRTKGQFVVRLVLTGAVATLISQYMQPFSHCNATNLPQVLSDEV